MITRIKRALLPAILILGFVLSITHHRVDDSVFYLWPAPSEFSSESLYVVNDMGLASAKSMHSATAIALPNGNLLSAWYAGTREGHTDVEIFSSVFNKQDQTWSQPRSILNRYQASDDLNRYIKKIGNPVLYRHPSGVTALFYVSVSMAGWATSQLNMMLSYDDGQTWHASKRLVLTPFLNISTLIKNDVVTYQDGTIGITAYHELIGEFSHIVRVDLAGNVIDSYRMTHGDHTIQPSLMVYDEQTAVSLFRDTSHDIEKVQRAVTHDAGKTWDAYTATQVNNPNSAVYGFVDLKGRSWMVFNDATRQSETPRNNLALAVSEDEGKTWRTVHHFENPQHSSDDEGRYAYPWVLREADNFHVFYTWNREKFKHIWLNQAWLEAQL